MSIFGIKNTSSVRISPNQESLLWKVMGNEENVRVKVAVDSACGYICWKHGEPNKEAMNAFTVNPKRDDILLLGYNRDMAFEIKYGVGGIPYTDGALSAVANIGLHGSFYVRVMNAVKLYGAFKLYEKITPDDVQSKILPELQDIMKGMAAEMLQRYGYELFSHQNELAEQLNSCGAIQEKLKAMGLGIDRGFTVDWNLDELQRLKQKDAKRRRKERAEFKQLETIIALRGSMQAIAKPPVGDGKVCPECKAPVSSPMTYCVKCGKYLK